MQVFCEDTEAYMLLLQKVKDAPRAPTGIAAADLRRTPGARGMEESRQAASQEAEANANVNVQAATQPQGGSWRTPRRSLKRLQPPEAEASIDTTTNRFEVLGNEGDGGVSHGEDGSGVPLGSLGVAADENGRPKRQRRASQRGSAAQRAAGGNAPPKPPASKRASKAPSRARNASVGQTAAHRNARAAVGAQPVAMHAELVGRPATRSLARVAEESLPALGNGAPGRRQALSEAGGLGGDSGSRGGQGVGLEEGSDAGSPSPGPAAPTAKLRSRTGMFTGAARTRRTTRLQAKRDRQVAASLVSLYRAGSEGTPVSSGKASFAGMADTTIKMMVRLFRVRLGLGFWVRVRVRVRLARLG
jgi:hypothetical protein